MEASSTDAVELWRLLGALVAAVPVIYLTFYLLRRASDWLHRPRVRAGEAVPAEFALPPAVVNLLVQRTDRAPRTISATLVDLAARGHLDLTQDGTDPTATTVRLSDPAPREPLTRYEQSVRRRVQDSGQRTLSALAQWRHTELSGWLRGLEDWVVEDAVSRGLLKGGDIRTGLGVIAVMTSCVLGLGLPVVGAAAVRISLDPEPGGNQVLDAIVLGCALACFPVIWVLTFLGFHALLGRRAERYGLTAEGRRAAAYWRGVQRWLRAHESFADLPPAAVTVWGRHLAYGVALDAAPTASAAIGLEGGTPSALGSHYGGRFHVVLVRYPPRRRSVPPAGVRAAAAASLLAVAGGAGWRWRGDLARLTGELASPVAAGLASAAVLGVAWLAYIGLRAGADLVHPARVQGTVIARLALTGYGRVHPPFAPVYLIVIDDGRSGTTKGWRADRRMGERAEPGTVVRARGQRWSRHLTSVERLGGGDSRPSR